MAHRARAVNGVIALGRSRLQSSKAEMETGAYANIARGDAGALHREHAWGAALNGWRPPRAAPAETAHFTFCRSHLTIAERCSSSIAM